MIGPSDFSHDKTKDGVEVLGLSRWTEEVGNITIEQKIKFLRTYLQVVSVSPETVFMREVSDTCRPKP